MQLRNILSVLLIALTVGFLFVGALAAASALPVQDLAQYWAAAHLVAKNPYSSVLVTQFERSAGIVASGAPMVMRNPPWAMVFVLPLRLLNYQSAFASWALFSVVVLAGCARASWKLNSAEESPVPALLSLLFGPTVCLLMLGQLAILVLLGVTLFLCLTERRRDWLAGASLSLVSVKPHVALIFLIAIALWTVRYKRWAVLIGAGLTTIVSSIAVLLINPHIFAQYLAFASQFVGETTPYPNVGGILFSLTGQHHLAFLPQAAGLAWLIFYWRKNRTTWDWKTNGMLVLLVSVACSYYSFPFDEIVILPALIAAYAYGNRTVFVTGFIATNIGYAMYIFKLAGNFGFGYMFLWWTASAWLLTFALSQKMRLRLSPTTVANHSSLTEAGSQSAHI